MRGTIRDNFIEAAVGFLVVLVAALFVWFAWDNTGGGLRQSISVKALFPSANGVSVGTDVRVAGLRVGSVTAERLDPQSFQAEVTLALDQKVSIPSDSSAAITSDGLLGGSHIAIVPGGSETPLKNGDTIIDTQGSVDMMGLIGSFINKGDSSSPEGGAGAGGGLDTMNEAAPQ